MDPFLKNCLWLQAQNHSNTWRRVIVIRYLAASCRLGREIYTGFRDAEDFPREYFLVAGEDTEGYGARRSPFDSGGSPSNNIPYFFSITIESVDLFILP